MNSKKLKYLIYVYFSLTLFEFSLVGPLGSFLKYYGALIMVIWIYYSIDFKMNITREKYIIALILWLIYCLISIIWTPNKNIGVYYFLASANMVCILFVVSNIKWTVSDFQKISLSMQASALLFSLIMIKSPKLYHGEGIRFTIMLFGKENDPNNITGLLIPAIILSIDNIVKKGKWRIISLMTFVATIISSFMAASRGGMLGVICSIFIYFTFYIYNNKKKIKIFNVIGFIFVILFTFYMVTGFVNKQLIERLKPENIGLDEGAGRILLWEKGLELYRQKPFIGWGIAAYSGITGFGMHNQYLLILVETGLIGFILFMYSLLNICKKLFRMHNEVGLAVMIGMMVIIFFLDAYQKKYMWNAFILATIIIKIYSYNYDNS